jgi:hypothetical protein
MFHQYRLIVSESLALSSLSLEQSKRIAENAATIKSIFNAFIHLETVKKIIHNIEK